jgi:DUF2075 family protein
VTPQPPPTIAAVSAAERRQPWAWAGSVGEFVREQDATLLAAADEHFVALCRELPGASQKRAWKNEIAVLRSALEEAPSAEDWFVILEYELPFEGGRRPDVILLAGEAIVVLEFKEAQSLAQAHYDQVAAYARDLEEYHRESHWRTVRPILVGVNAHGAAPRGGVDVADARSLAGILSTVALPGHIEARDWLEAGYAPLPSLVQAARRIFQHEPLPHVRRALAARIPETVSLISDLIAGAERSSQRRLILLTGAPGAGKTLVGLRLVYEQGSDHRASSTFLSGNGPLVKVLQDALKSSVFVRDLHKFISTYAQSTRVPDQHVIVFDEAQRAWDRRYMQTKRKLDSSEPDLLVSIAERLPGWVALVGLVGTGQSIYSGEERGLEQWREALERSGPDGWDVWCSPAIEREFSGLAVNIDTDLELRVPVRSRRAEKIDDWVAALLDGRLSAAEALSLSIVAADFPMYVTRSRSVVERYVHDRYSNHPDARYGLVASSHARNLVAHGVDNEWMATSRMNIAKWFNAPPSDPLSCCALRQPVTEFGCQGLELDLPVVCWGTDLTWRGSNWLPTPRRRQYPQDDPVQLLMNTYRVLLTRGRDGFFIWVPPDPSLDETAEALRLAGIRMLNE